MIYAILMSLFTSPLNSGQLPLAYVRSLYYKAAVDNRAAKAFEKELQNQSKEKDVVVYAYKGMSKMLMARNSFNPYLKLTYFREGKSILEESIGAEPRNAELRLLRFSVQSNAPGFLNYYQNVDSDKKILLTYLKDTENRANPIYGDIRKILLDSSACTEEEKELIRRYSS